MKNSQAINKSTCFSHLFQAFAATKQLNVHVTGVLSHGLNKKYLFTDLHQYKHDSNLTLNVLMKVLWNHSKVETIINHYNYLYFSYKELLQSIHVFLIHRENHCHPFCIYKQTTVSEKTRTIKFVQSFLELLVRRRIFYEVNIYLIYMILLTLS